MSLLDYVGDYNKWMEYYNYKIDKKHLSKKEEKELLEFINQKRYLAIYQNNFNFSLPIKHFINKSGSTKKRVVYSFSEDESYVLKLIAFNLYKYDDQFMSNLYSFRKNRGVKKALYEILKIKNIKNMYCYKLDIRNYFNSINCDILIPILQKIFIDDSRLYNFFKELLEKDKAIYNDNIVEEKRGAMAGTPISPFLANVYLNELDKFFIDIPYARYSDDIILFAETKEELDQCINNVLKILSKYDLQINEDKEKIIAPEGAWEFLGVQYKNGIIDLSSMTINKIKSKIRRKARSIRRYKVRSQVPTEKAMQIMIKHFNKKFYENVISNDLTWSRWFFPLISSDKGLHEVDEYFIQYLRYLHTGRFTKGNYEITYEMIKNCQYKSLVNEYYKYKKNSDEK